MIHIILEFLGVPDTMLKLKRKKNIMGKSYEFPRIIGYFSFDYYFLCMNIMQLLVEANKRIFRPSSFCGWVTIQPLPSPALVTESVSKAPPQASFEGR